MRIVHAADIHLDSPLRGLLSYEGAPAARIQGASRRALANLVDYCLNEAVDVLLIVGDLYDGNWRDYSTGLFFATQMGRLSSAGTRVAIVRGNHDAASQITKHLTLPPHVHEFSSAAPETYEVEGLPLAIHGQSFAHRAVTDDLAQNYPRAVPGVFNIGMLHTALSGYPGHERYAPTTVETLLARGYDYWALGHIHTRTEVHVDPYIVFPGNLQGRHMRETGPKGASVLEIDGGRLTQVRHVDMDVVRFERCNINIEAIDRVDQLIERFRTHLIETSATIGDRLLSLRVELVGTTSFHAALTADLTRWENEIRVAAHEIAGDDVWIERVDLLTRPASPPLPRGEESEVLAELARTVDAYRNGTRPLEDLAASFADLTGKLPVELGDGDEAKADDPSTLRALLEDAEALLAIRLSGQAGPK